MAHPKFVELILDHRAVTEDGVSICEDHCMVCPIKAAVEANVHPAFEMENMGAAVTDFLASYRRFKDATGENPLQTLDDDEVSPLEVATRQADPKDLFRFVFHEWYWALRNQGGVAK